MSDISALGLLRVNNNQVITFGVSPGLNEVRGAHYDERDVVRRVPRGARREEAHVATCVQTPRIKITQL